MRNSHDLGGLSVTVAKTTLLARLKQNKIDHAADYSKAFAAFKAKSLADIDDIRKKMEGLTETVDPNSGRVFINFAPPQNNAKCYDRAISMVDSHTGADLTLTTEQYAAFMDDEWEWTDAFRKMSTDVGYSNSKW